MTGFFDQTTLDSQLANLECNSTACVKVTHHFLKKMVEKKIKGCFIFTSSVSGYIPNPFAVMYGATKAFVSQFAASLAIEVRNNGIDVLAVHPSPVASNFFEKAHKLESLEMAQKSAVSPASVPGKMLMCVGRCHLGKEYSYLLFSPYLYISPLNIIPRMLFKLHDWHKFHEIKILLGFSYSIFFQVIWVRWLSQCVSSPP